MKKYFKYLQENTCGLMGMLGFVIGLVVVVVALAGFLYLMDSAPAFGAVMNWIGYAFAYFMLVVLVLGLAVMVFGGLIEYIVLTIKFLKKKRSLNGRKQK